MSELEPIFASKHPAKKLAACVVCLLVLSLTVSVATRTFRLSFAHGRGLVSGSPHPRLQHPDRDCLLRVPPTPLWAVYEAATFYPRLAPAGPPLPSQLLDDVLYNRPPPSC